MEKIVSSCNFLELGKVDNPIIIRTIADMEAAADKSKDGVYWYRLVNDITINTTKYIYNNIYVDLDGKTITIDMDYQQYNLNQYIKVYNGYIIGNVNRSNRNGCTRAVNCSTIWNVNNANEADTRGIIASSSIVNIRSSKHSDIAVDLDFYNIGNVYVRGELQKQGMIIDGGRSVINLDIDISTKRTYGEVYINALYGVRYTGNIKINLDSTISVSSLRINIGDANTSESYCNAYIDIDERIDIKFNMLFNKDRIIRANISKQDMDKYGRTDVEMRDINTYIGFKFRPIEPEHGRWYYWIIDKDKNGGYPYLNFRLDGVYVSTKNGINGISPLGFKLNKDSVHSNEINSLVQVGDSSTGYAFPMATTGESRKNIDHFRVMTQYGERGFKLDDVYCTNEDQILL